MNKKILYALILLAVVVGIILCLQERGRVAPSAGKLVTGSALETFSGTVTAVDTGCFYDAICSVSVDGKKVVIVKGGRGMDPNTKVGRLLGVESISDITIGDHANVYATTTSEGDYSIYGNSNYYVEIVNIKKLN